MSYIYLKLPILAPNIHIKKNKEKISENSAALAHLGRDLEDGHDDKDPSQGVDEVRLVPYCHNTKDEHA